MFSVCGSIHDFALLIAKRIVSPVFFKKVEGFCYHNEGLSYGMWKPRANGFAKAISSRGSFGRGSATFLITQ